MKRSAEPASDKMKAEFRQKLENFQAAPSASLWDKIETSLDKEDALIYKNRMRIYARLAAACLLLLLAFSAFFIPKEWHKFKTQKPAIALTENKNTAGNQTIIDENNAEKTADATLEIAASNTNDVVIKTLPETEKTAEFGLHKKRKTVAFGPEKVIASQVKESPVYLAKIAATKGRKADSAKNPEVSLAASETGKPEESLALNMPAKTNMASEIMADETSEKVTTQGRDAKLLSYNSDRPAKKTSQYSGVGLSGSPAKILSQNQNSGAARSALPVSKNAHALTFSAPNNTVSAKPENQFTNKDSAELQLANLAEIKLPQPAFAAQTNTDSVKKIKPAEIEKMKPKTRRWSAGVAYAALGFKQGIHLASQPVNYPNDPSIGTGKSQMENDYENAAQEFNSNTNSAYSQAVNLQISYQLKDNWVLQSGLIFLQNRAQTNSTYLFRNPGQSPATSVVGPSAATNVQTTLQTIATQSFDAATSQIIKTEPFPTQYRYIYIGVPVNLRFELSKQAFYGFVAPGFSVNRLIQAAIIIKEPHYAGTVAEGKIFNSWLPAIQLQTGVGYKISGSWNLETAVQANQFLKPLLKNEQAAGAKQNKPLNLGATLGLNYNF